MVTLFMTNRIEPTTSYQTPASHPVSRNAVFEVHRRMTSCMGLPQVGHEAMRGAGTSTSGVLNATGRCLKISCRRVSIGMAQFAFIKPKWRTFMKPAGRTCWRKRRINAMTSSWVVRGRELPGLRYVKVTMRSVSETMRLLEMATLKTYGARYL